VSLNLGNFIFESYFKREDIWRTSYFIDWIMKFDTHIELNL